MATVQNHDIVGLAKRLDRYVQELHKSVSAQSSELNTFDASRAAANLAALRAFQTWVVGQPQLDLPETSPADLTLEDMPATPEVESDAINDLIRLARLLREELANSQSARKSAGLVVFDSARLTALLDKSESLLAATVAAQPLDLPESSPRSATAGAGRKGT